MACNVRSWLVVVASVSGLASGLGCSSSDPAPAPSADTGDAGLPLSGIAHYRVGGASGSPESACPSPTADITIAVDGKPFSTGSNGTVSCAFNDTRFSISLKDTHGDLVTAEGTFSGEGSMSSTDAKMAIGVPAFSYASAAPCVVTFTQKSGGALLGKFTCPEIDDSSMTQKCAITAVGSDGAPESYFQFASCTRL